MIFPFYLHGEIWCHGPKRPLPATFSGSSPRPEVSGSGWFTIKTLGIYHQNCMVFEKSMMGLIYPKKMMMMKNAWFYHVLPFKHGILPAKHRGSSTKTWDSLDSWDTKCPRKYLTTKLHGDMGSGWVWLTTCLGHFATYAYIV